MLFNIYLDFILRCVEHRVLPKFPNTGLQYAYRIPGHRSTRKQRSVHGLSGVQRIRLILYADDIALFCTNVDELMILLPGLVYKTETMAFNVPEEIKSKRSLIFMGVAALKNVRTLDI